MKRTAEVRFGCNNVCQFISDGPGAGWTTNSFVPPRCNKHCAAMAAAVCVSNTANADGPGTPFHAFLSPRESSSPQLPIRALNLPILTIDPSSFLFSLAFGMVKNVGLLPNDRFDCDSMSCNWPRLFRSRCHQRFVVSENSSPVQNQPFSADPHRMWRISHAFVRVCC